jgi:hypothetical protein
MARGALNLLGWGVRLDLLTFDYEEARKPGKTEAPAEFAEKCRNGFHHRGTEDTEVEGFLSVGEVPTDKKKNLWGFGSLDF